MNQEDMCGLRKQILGLSGCLECPSLCCVKDNNSNIIANKMAAFPEAFPEFKGADGT